jgi:N-acetylmuramoyl-L-alanine amidase
MKILQLKQTLIIFFLILLASTIYAKDSRKIYFEANHSYSELLKNKVKLRSRVNWISTIRKFQEVYKKDPHGPFAPASLYKTGLIYKSLYGYSNRKTDILESIDIFERIQKRYPGSAYSAKAKRNIKRIRKPKKSPSKKVSLTNGRKVINSLRHYSSKNYTRIVIDLSGPVEYSHNKLHKPERIFVDIKGCKIGRIPKFLKINDNLLKDARASQKSPDVVRVVFDIKSINNYKIFSLKSPFRIVIDVQENGRHIPKNDRQISKREKLPKIKIGRGKNIKVGAIARQLALGVKTIVIDPGHGGRDSGAPGYHRGTYEKDIVLSISKRLAKKIRRKIGCKVYLTRTRDIYISLEERTAIANTKNADLFISIHTNASRNKRASGIETYFLNLATDNAAITVAARENATSKKNISDLQSILNDLMKNAKINESSLLARYVHKYLYNHISRKYKRVNNKGVKQAPFYVLLGARMPSILIEASFISNKIESKRLKSRIYQDRICEGITSGIKEYIRRITR